MWCCSTNSGLPVEGDPVNESASGGTIDLTVQPHDSGNVTHADSAVLDAPDASSPVMRDFYHQNLHEGCTFTDPVNCQAEEVCLT